MKKHERSKIGEQLAKLELAYAKVRREITLLDRENAKKDTVKTQG